MQLSLEVENPFVNREIYSNILQDIKHKVDKVRFIMEHFPDARNNDNYLCVQYWKLVDGVKDIDDIIASTKPEVIRRARQKIQESGILLPTDPDVARRRRMQAEEMRAGINQLELQI